MTVRFDRRLRRGCLVAVLAAAVAGPALAQQIGPSGQPEFRDPKTGQIWTPENVGSGKNTDLSIPADRAFNPKAQATTVEGTAVQAPSIKVLGSVPITAGPNVPIAVIDSPTLSVIPGQRWQMALYLNNNSAGTISPVVECRFANGNNTVENARAGLPPVAAGQRVGFVIYGPPSNIFVDRADRQLVSRQEPPIGPSGRHVGPLMCQRAAPRVADRPAICRSGESET